MATPCPKCGEYRNGRHEHACKSVPTVQPMNARERMVRVVAEALAEHREVRWSDKTYDCTCTPAHESHRGWTFDQFREHTAEAVVAAMEANATHQPRKNTDVVSPADEPPIAPRAGFVRLAGCFDDGEGGK